MEKKEIISAGIAQRAESQRLGEILPETLLGIKSRCNRYRKERGLPIIDEELAPNPERDVKRKAMDAEQEEIITQFTRWYTAQMAMGLSVEDIKIRLFPTAGIIKLGEQAKVG